MFHKDLYWMPSSTLKRSIQIKIPYLEPRSWPKLPKWTITTKDYQEKTSNKPKPAEEARRNLEIISNTKLSE